MAEEWRPVKGYEGLYEVSDLGNVQSLLARFGGLSANPTKRCRLLKATLTLKGYKYVKLYDRNSAGRKFFVHRLVALAFLGECPTKQVNHKDSDRGNNHISNLEWVTPKENSEHMVSCGRSARGSKSGRSKLTESQVECLRLMKSENPSMTNETLGRTFGIARTSVGSILRGKRWGHL